MCRGDHGHLRLWQPPGVPGLCGPHPVPAVPGRGLRPRSPSSGPRGGQLLPSDAPLPKWGWGRPASRPAYREPAREDEGENLVVGRPAVPRVRPARANLPDVRRPDAGGADCHAELLALLDRRSGCQIAGCPMPR